MRASTGPGLAIKPAGQLKRPTVAVMVRTDRDPVRMSAPAADAIAYMRARGMRLNASTCALLLAEGHANPGQALIDRFAPFGTSSTTLNELRRVLNEACVSTGGPLVSPFTPWGQVRSAGFAASTGPTLLLEYGTGDGSCAIPHPMQIPAGAIAPAGQTVTTTGADMVGPLVIGVLIGVGATMVAYSAKKKARRGRARRRARS